MTIVGILPAFLLGLVFVALGIFVWKRKRHVGWIPLVIGAALILFAFNVYGNANGRKLAIKDYNRLVNELNRPDLSEFLADNTDDETLYFVSLASQALFAAAERFPGQKDRVSLILADFAGWVADGRNFSAWGKTSNWNEQAFFLSHAGIILGHYQLVSQDETHAKRFRQASEFLGRALPGSRYKNLISRPEEDVRRAADNAAAIYAVYLHDRYYATQLAAAAYDDWREYLLRELEYRESHLPCSGFTDTNRCKLDPTASPLGMMLGYLAAAGMTDQQLYREWLHYFKDFGLSPLSLNFKSEMRAKGAPRFCDIAAYPLGCRDHLSAIGLWVSAEYGGSYTFARLLSRQLITDGLPNAQQLSGMRPIRRRIYLKEIAIRVMAEMH